MDYILLLLRRRIESVSHMYAKFALLLAAHVFAIAEGNLTVVAFLTCGSPNSEHEFLGNDHLISRSWIRALDTNKTKHMLCWRWRWS